MNNRIVRYFSTIFLTILSLSVTNTSSLWAFTCHREVRGPLTFEISKIDALSVEGMIYKAPLTIENSSDQAFEVLADFSSIDSVVLYDGEREVTAPNSYAKKFLIKAHSSFSSEIAFAVRGAYRDAHYPIRANFSFVLDDGQSERVELRPVFAVNLTERLVEKQELKTLELKEQSFLKLTGSNITNFSAYWKRFDGDFQRLANGWSGVHPDGKCSFNPTTITRGEVRRSCWSIHPPYDGGPGVFGLRYAVSLPKSQKIELRFFRAMRDVFAPEPPTDGVIFRVYATSLGSTDENVSVERVEEALNTVPNADGLLLNEQYAGTTWSEVNLDLSKYAGQTILLTFEADPGVKRDTTCDNSFWGDVALMSDPQDVVISNDAERELLKAHNKNAFETFVAQAPKATPSSGVELNNNSRGFALDDGQYAVVTLGHFGICDGWVTLGTADKYVQIAGVRTQYQGVNVGFERPLAPCCVSTSFVDKNDLEKEARVFAYAHKAEIIGDLPVDAHFDAKDFEGIIVPDTPENALACFISQTLGGLAFRFVATHNEEIETLQFGPTSEKASRIYFGHGHCIVEPKQPFTQEGDGFGCASSHVGFDFANGISLLQATTRPVNNFVVNPDLHVYTLTTCPDSRLTLRSSDKGALDCAMKYAPGFDKRAALLVPKKAGRFVYDYWGGSHAHVLERMKAFIDYGLDDSLLIQHSWQHYGYDVRLPDIWPPRTDQGSLEELKEIQDFCDSHGIPFGLHDNYIDFYPDADGFTYDDIIMNPDGLPQKAWYNPGPDAQSYRFNPTKIQPFVERNLELIRKDLMQTAYFTDVFSSIHIMDFYDSEGKFHSRAETLDCWNKYFDLVHEKFNNNAITVSESGNDALIGHLDGADAILRRITPTQENYSTVVPSADCEYVPWFDAVNHKRFILHGVGYSDRYQGGISRALRGIESDDYLSSEVLTGHAIMADLAMSIRGTVRKYWLLQNYARSIALDDISDFEFIENDVHRQKITWKSGVIVYVNRGIEDWQIDELTLADTEQPVVLPRFGFWILGPGNVYGGIVRIHNQIVELRVDGDRSYFVNGRQLVPHQVTPIRPTYEEVEVLDGSTIQGNLVWDAIKGTDKPYVPFLHFERPQTWWNDKPELHVLPLNAPNKTSDSWQGREADLFGGKVVVRVPDDLDAGYYNLLCGLYDPKSGIRLPLLGSGTYDSRYRLGAIVVEGRGKDRKLTFEPVPTQHDVDLRLVPNEKATDFGFCSTVGAFRFTRNSDDSATITPLPNEPVFTVSLTSPFFQKGNFVVVKLDRIGRDLGSCDVQTDGKGITLTIDSSEAFAYRVVKKL